MGYNHQKRVVGRIEADSPVAKLPERGDPGQYALNSIFHRHIRA